ncbi:hypothetical protein BDL97_15G087400 [Sphagnum fallax]|nr:hypothetical protein BDL97_15G087400 [Sphagnum fallax]
MYPKNGSNYVKDNDVRLGLKVSTRATNGGSQVTGLQCHFCIAFGREEKVGAKRQALTAIQGWMRPFCYDNIESHCFDSIVERQAFFDYVPVAFRNSIKAHFPSSSFGAERQILFDIEKDIVDVIVCGMMFDPTDIVDNNADSDAEENDPTFASNILSCTYDVLHNPVLRACCHHYVANYIRVMCVVNHQHIVRHLRRAWAFSIVLDSATHQSTSYLDVMFQMVVSFLDVFRHGWKVHLLGVTSDGARNMTGRVFGVIIHLNNVMHNECLLTRVWCGAHQLDLVMEHIMDTIVKERFFTIMTRFITHLTWQLNLITDMKTMCPRVVNCLLSMEKLLAYIESKQPPSAPPRLWWVSLLAMHHFTSRTTITFRMIQGLTTLLDQQQAALVGLVASLMEDVGVTRPLIVETTVNLDASSHVISGRYAVSLSSVDSIVDEVDEGQRSKLFNNIASVYVTACNLLPHELVKLSTAEFIRKMRCYSYRLEQRYSSEHINTIADEYKQLLHAYRTDQLAFKDGWSLLGRPFSNLMEFCGVIATLFPGTSTIESDFSILRWEKDAFRKSLSDFGLEGMLQAKQWMFIEPFEP